MFLGLACGQAPEPTLTIRVLGTPAADTVSVFVSTVPDDSCFQLPHRYDPVVARSGIVLKRKCFLNEPTYELDAWTYGAGCCTRDRGKSSFQGYVDPGARQLPPSLLAEVVLAAAQGPLTCNPNASCGPD